MPPSSIYYSYNKTKFEAILILSFQHMLSFHYLRFGLRCDLAYHNARLLISISINLRKAPDKPKGYSSPYHWIASCQSGIINMMAKNCFEPGCMNEVGHAHANLPNRAHNLDSIFMQPYEGTKEAFLEFIDCYFML
ncbi:unnamed protein product [Blepharisma stoltei]|uniref:Uncharacterized protein n=1 Tax=Blepharisma stoltei TaxID=1481888 RepID=A0AAU9K6W4_9CILI|nr:unnamed protein product [Blepharisma stoltei]